MTASPVNAASIFSALDEAPMTWRHYAYWLAASGGAFLDGFSVSGLGVALPLLKRDFPISPLFVGLIGSALVLGAVAGSALGGIGADRFGRKRVFIADMAIIALACFIGAVGAERPRHPAVAVPAWRWRRHRFSDERRLCVGAHAARDAQQNDGRDDRPAIGRHGGGGSRRPRFIEAAAVNRRLAAAVRRQRRDRVAFLICAPMGAGKRALAGRRRDGSAKRRRCSGHYRSSSARRL